MTEDEWTPAQRSEAGVSCMGCGLRFNDGLGLGFYWFCSESCAFQHGGTRSAVIGRKECKHCGRRFKTTDGLVAHIRSRHPETI